MGMRIDGHYDAEADIAWVRFENYDPSTVVAEETDTGLRERDPKTGEVVGLDSGTRAESYLRTCWGCSRRRKSRLPSEGHTVETTTVGVVVGLELERVPRAVDSRRCTARGLQPRSPTSSMRAAIAA